MAETKPIKTSVGELRWVFFTGRGKEGKGQKKGTFKYVASRYMKSDDPECLAFKKKIRDFWNDNKPKGVKCKSLGFRDEVLVDEDYEPILDKGGREQLTGETSFNFWTGVTWPDGKPKVVDIYSAGNKAEGIVAAKISLKGKSIGNGTIGAIAGTMGLYAGEAHGVSLYLDAIQIHKLVEYSKDPGFEASDEGGYEGEVETESETSFEPEEESKEEAKPRI